MKDFLKVNFCGLKDTDYCESGGQRDDFLGCMEMELLEIIYSIKAKCPQK